MRNGVDCKGKEWQEITLDVHTVDATGMRFGRLVALFPVKCRNKKQWLCQCDCGNELVVAYGVLNCGNTKSCGCMLREKSRQRWEKYREEQNYIGKKFGRLTVVKFLYIKDEAAVYLFHCDCGNDVALKIDVVKRGNTRSCGCLHQEFLDATKSDIIGQRFGKLVVERYVGIDKHGNTLFECKCDCGNISVVTRHSLTRDHTHSCGCIVSVGESNIKKILQESNIKYKSQQTFPDLRSDCGKELQYDFGLLGDNDAVIRLIEFDGPQHEEPVDHFGGEERFIQQQKSDARKNQYALSHNIPLVRIPYNKRDSMDLNDLLSSQYLFKGGD